jgi:hypothetical protein
MKKSLNNADARATIEDVKDKNSESVGNKGNPEAEECFEHVVNI